jgi:class 3 adenylate cyclase/tetratricopeptide (TPR) repeat protein
MESRKLVSVVFCDLVDFAQMGRGLDAESLRTIIGRYFEAMRDAVERHGGTVEKFIGDAVVAVFGIPAVHEDDALRAVRAATEMRDALDPLNQEFSAAWGVRLHTRTGVNSGEVLATDGGGGQSFMTGRSVVLAARLEHAAGVDEILLGAETFNLVRDAVSTELVGPLQLKGIGDEVVAHRLLGVIPGAAGHSRRLDSPLVDRDRESVLLHQTFERTVAGRRCQLFTILGAAGVGKSRLVEEFLTTGAEHALVLRGRCLPYGKGITFWPVVEIVREAAGLSVHDSPREARRKIAVVVAGEHRGDQAAERVAHAIGIGESAGGPDDTLWAIRTFLEALARSRPIVVLIDDLHWAEPTLLDLVDHVVDWSKDVSIMLIALARPELLEIRPTWGRGKMNAASVLLEPLTANDSEVLVGNLLGAQVDAHARDRIIDAAGGNPLFVEEIVSMLVEEGLLIHRDDRWIASDVLTTLAIPPTISALLTARLDRLPPDERTIIERAAIVGREFPVGALETLVSHDLAAGVDASLDSLVRKELLKPVRSQDPEEGEAYGYRHLLIRDAAYESIPKGVRAELHERFAEWLVVRAGSRFEEYEEILGYHLELAYRYTLELGPAGDRGRILASSAGSYLCSAGRRAYARGDMPAATNLLERAADLLPPEHASVSTLLPDLAESLMQTGRSNEAAKAWERLLWIAQGRGDEALAVMAELESSYVRFLNNPRQTDIEEFRDVATEAVRVHRDLGDAGKLATSLVYLALTHWFAGEIDAMLAVSEQAIELAARTDEVRALLWAASSVGTALLLGRTPCEQALERVRRLIDDFPEPRTLQATAQLDLARMLGMVEGFDEAMNHARHARTVLEDLGQGGWLAEAALTIGTIARWRGDLDLAERETRLGHRLFRDRGDLGNAALAARDLARTLMVRRQLEEARALADEILSETGAYDLEPQIEGRSILAQVQAYEGALVDAERLAREALSLVEPTQFLNLHGEVLSDLAEILMAAGRSDAAHGAAEESFRRFQQKGNQVGMSRSRKIIERVID